MKRIRLNNGMFTLVDNEDFKHLCRWKWYAAKGVHTFYAMRTIHVPKDKTLILHREVMKAPKGKEVDHINGNGLDNRKKNLRICTKQQNQMNRHHLNANNTSGFTGVSYMKRWAIWIAYAHGSGKRKKYLGAFKKKSDAIKARKDYMDSL